VSTGADAIYTAIPAFSRRYTPATVKYPVGFIAFTSLLYYAVLGVKHPTANAVLGVKHPTANAVLGVKHPTANAVLGVQTFPEAFSRVFPSLHLLSLL
jgi:hypothetical protein